MNDSTPLSVLKRKAQVGQERRLARAMTAARALRISMAKVAEAELELALAVIGLTEGVVQQANLLPEVDPSALLLLLEAPGRGGGAAILEPALVGALVQQQTMGMVSELPPDATERKVTRTDAALVAPFLDQLFKKLAPLPEEDADKQLFHRVCYGDFMGELRLLRMAMEADEYVHFSVTLDVAIGKRQGKIDLYLPRPSVGIEVMADEPDLGPQIPQTLEPVVMDVCADLNVSLCRLQMTLADLSELSAGDTLALPEGILEKTEVLTIDGNRIATGKLGQIGGMRAVKLLHKGASLPSAKDMQEQSVASGSDSMMDIASAELALPSAAPEEKEWPEIDYGDDLPSIPGLEDSDDGLPELPALPDIPGMDDMGGDGDLPDLPSLPDSDEMPELPALPDLVKEA